MAYSTERKASVVAKMLPPHNQSLKRLSAEEGISVGTLSRWRAEARARGQLLPDGQLARIIHEALVCCPCCRLLLPRFGYGHVMSTSGW